MINMKVVIGSNWGDEGKGQVTDYLAHKAISSNKNCLVVLCNGGAQRGHTVTTSNGLRHVFHHFGSGTFAGADTYLDRRYILNPMTFHKEWNELKTLGFIPTVYVSPFCKWSTPYDMFINQILEDSRGDKRHGSCGMGIWETEVRYSVYKYMEHRFREILTVSRDILKDFLIDIRDNYLVNRLRSEGVYEVPVEWMGIVYSDNIIENYLDDLEFMLHHVKFVEGSAGNESEFIKNYDNVIFEMGQGLMLSDINSDNADNSTPSLPGLYLPLMIAGEAGQDKKKIEVFYVTRSYLTRHGAGTLPGECPKSDINISMEDKTNVPNPFQGSLRYARLTSEQMEYLIHRTLNDYEDMISYGFRGVSDENSKVNLVITHMNEYEPLYNLSDIEGYDKILISDGETRESFEEYRI